MAKKGDLFIWVYERDNEPVRINEELYSTVMEKCIPCDGLCFCVYVCKKEFWWISNGMLFSASRQLIHSGRRDNRGRMPHILPRRIKF